MSLAKTTCKELGAKQVGVIKDRKSLCLMMHVIRRRHAMASSDDAQCSILDRLKSSFNQPWLYNGTPDARGVRVRGANVETEGVEESR